MDPHATTPPAEPAAGLDDETLARLFTLVYTGYYVPMHVDAPVMRFMRVACDLDLEASRLLRVGGEAVAVAMLGRRGSAGWIGGMGVAPTHRGRGLGEHVMRAAIESGRERGVRRVLLEVLEQNRPAICIYERMGFRRVRDLEVWSFPAPDFEDGGPALEPADLDEAIAFVRAHRQAPEPWQRADATLDALRRDGAAFEGLLAKRGGDTVGAMVCRVAGRASIVQLATRPGHEAGATRALLASLRRDDAPQGVRWLNLPADDPAAAVLRSLGAAREALQHEMELALD